MQFETVVKERQSCRNFDAARPVEKEKLERTGCRILGAVLNKVDVRKDKYYSKYTHYYHYD